MLVLDSRPAEGYWGLRLRFHLHPARAQGGHRRPGGVRNLPVTSSSTTPTALPPTSPHHGDGAGGGGALHVRDVGQPPPGQRTLQPPTFPLGGHRARGR